MINMSQITKKLAYAASVACVVTGLNVSANAQSSKERTPDLPPPLQTMQAEGAELNICHKDGLDGGSLYKMGNNISMCQTMRLFDRAFV